MDAPVAGREKDAPKCEDCYFRKKMLCALDLEEPCSTFRPSRPEGLVPPKQPVLLLRPPRWADDRRITSSDPGKPVPAHQAGRPAVSPAGA